MTSKDEKYLTRFDDHKLEVASVKDFSFKRIAGTSESNSWLGGVTWSTDGAKLAYIITKDLEPDEPFGSYENKLYVIDRDGSNQKLIKQFQKPREVSLVGFNSLSTNSTGLKLERVVIIATFQ